MLDFTSMVVEKVLFKGKEYHLHTTLPKWQGITVYTILLFALGLFLFFVLKASILRRHISLKSF